jgi:hypothetical protein
LSLGGFSSLVVALFDVPSVVDSETVLAILFSIFATVVGGSSVVVNL